MCKELRRLLFLLAFFFLITVLVSGQIAPDPSKQSADEAILRELTARFYYDYEKCDYEDQLSMWSPKSEDDSSKRKNTISQFTNYDQIKVQNFSINHVAINGDSADVRITVHVSAISKKTGKPMGPVGGWMGRDIYLTHKLIRENGKWLLLWQTDTAPDFVAELLKAKTEGEWNQLLADNKYIVNSELASYLAGEASASGKRDFDWPRAYAVVSLALRLAEEFEDKKTIAHVLDEMAWICVSLGDDAQALVRFQRAIELNLEFGDVRYAANLQNSVGTVYANMGEYSQALNYFQKSVDGMKSPAGGMATMNVARQHLEVGDYDRATDMFEKGLVDLTERSNTETNVSRKSQLKRSIQTPLMGIGDVNKAQGSYAAALEYYLKALPINEESKFDKGALLTTLTKLADVYLLLGNCPEAQKYAQRAVALATDIGFNDRTVDPQVTLGQVYRALNQPDQARMEFDKAINTIEGMRGRTIGGEAARQRYFENKVSPYQAMIDLLVSQNKADEALAYAERAKARVLLDVLESGRSNVTRSMTAAEQAEERTLTARLVDLNTRFQTETGKPQSDPKKVDDLKAKLDQARLEHEAFRARLYGAHPELKIQRGQSQPITPNEAYSLLPDSKSALLEYVVSAGQTYLFVLTKDQAGGRLQPSSRVYSIPIKQKALADKVENYRLKLAQGDLDFGVPGRELYDLLLKPAREQLQGKNLLTIVPDGVLWNLPFQALQSSVEHYAIEDQAIFYSPSLSVLREVTKKQKKRQENSKTPQTLLAFGNPVVDNKADSGKKAALMGEDLDPLPEAEKQVNALARLYGPARSRVYIGTDATEERAKEESPYYRVLQFATHGILDSSSPMYSHLVLSHAPVDTNQDGLLEAWEVMDMNLHADMVVLAACETARGRVGAGEGMIGMSWAFFIAGAPTTIASQWKVESSSTTELMLEFHRQLLNGKTTKAEALRRAELKLLKNSKYQHPSYWAAWVLVGDGS